MILRCLILEDDPNHAKQLSAMLELAWQHLKSTATIQTDVVHEHGDATSKLATAGPYQVFLSDLMFPDGAWGIACIEQAKLRNPEGTVVIAISKNPDLEDRARAAGADDFMQKDELMSSGVAVLKLAMTLEKWLPKRGHAALLSPSLHVNWVENDWPLSALIERIGPDALARIAGEMFSDAIELHATYVRSGLSGAVVLRLDGSDKRGPLEPLLVKLARDQELIVNELRARDLTGEFPPNAFISFGAANKQRPFESGGWFAIGSPFAEGARTATDWVTTTGRKPNEAVVVINRLFTAKLSRRTWPIKDKRPNSFLFETLVSPRKARIWLAARDLEKLGLKYGSVLDFNPKATKAIEAFLRAGTFGETDEQAVPLGCSGRISHADLHGRNVLVTIEGDPFLIDSANIRPLHWAADVSRFLVDLFVSGWDSDPLAETTHYEWNEIEKWLIVAKAWFDGVLSNSKLPVKGGNAGIAAMIKWVEDNLSNVFPNIWTAEREWEYRLAIAIEFLRASYREVDLPTPKRVLALVVGCYGLKIASKHFQSPIKGN